ncbi:PIN domain nuclease [Aerophototrophica crusticola]|uniref:Ribonuclease VapC n=1 Tax=Aerophototrophica crusticola TaxID=1709002 RepID=A0A858RCQ9_9PROT|nr:PIN domain nuclease [Rhodospirillaceae bacterium B3]
MILVDTSVWIDHFRNIDSRETRVLRSHADLGSVLVGDLILTEVLMGARDDVMAARLGRALGAFPLANLFNRGAAVEVAANYRRLRALGLTIRKLPDLIIGSFCIAKDIPLLHADRDFEPMREHLGLRAL